MVTITSSKTFSLYPLIPSNCRFALLYPKYWMVNLPIPSSFSSLPRGWIFRVICMQITSCSSMKWVLCWLHYKVSNQVWAQEGDVSCGFPFSLSFGLFMFTSPGLDQEWEWSTVTLGSYCSLRGLPHSLSSPREFKAVTRVRHSKATVDHSHSWSRPGLAKMKRPNDRVNGKPQLTSPAHQWGGCFVDCPTKWAIRSGLKKGMDQEWEWSTFDAGFLGGYKSIYSI